MCPSHTIYHIILACIYQKIYHIVTTLSVIISKMRVCTYQLMWCLDLALQSSNWTSKTWIMDLVCLICGPDACTSQQCKAPNSYNLKDIVENIQSLLMLPWWHGFDKEDWRAQIQHDWNRRKINDTSIKIMELPVCKLTRPSWKPWLVRRVMV